MIGPFGGDEVVDCWTIRAMRGGERLGQRHAVDVASPMGEIVG